MREEAGGRRSGRRPHGGRTADTAAGMIVRSSFSVRSNRLKRKVCGLRLRRSVGGSFTRHPTHSSIHPHPLPFPPTLISSLKNC